MIRAPRLLGVVHPFSTLLAILGPPAAILDFACGVSVTSATWLVFLLSFSVVYFSHRRTAQNKELIFWKLIGGPNNLGAGPFPDCLGPFGTLLDFPDGAALRAVRKCPQRRQFNITPLAPESSVSPSFDNQLFVRWVNWIFSPFLWFGSLGRGSLQFQFYLWLHGKLLISVTSLRTRNKCVKTVRSEATVKCSPKY